MKNEADEGIKTINVACEAVQCEVLEECNAAVCRVE
jgi:hypothetical protein